MTKIQQRLKIPPGYFDFSKVQRHNEELDYWRSWFDQIGVRHLTVRNKRGEHILCREKLKKGGRDHGR